ncbi:MAG: hypothetical protein QGI09_04360 [Dehalococcoidia bacterium]|jgi:hypothetical protein|nr:hypothetical protein [Dehalococcoidia bacterium]
MAAMLLGLMAIVVLFTIGMGGVYVFLRLYDRLFLEKKMGLGYEDEREETSRT